MLRGENFLIRTESEIENLGFMTTRRVTADSVEEAEVNAVDLIRNDPALIGVMADQDESLPPKIFAEEIYPCKWWKKTGGKGYTFFDMDKLDE